MEKVKATEKVTKEVTREVGVYLNAKDIKKIVEENLEWTEVSEDQTFCVKGIMSDATPIGTSIIVGVDGIKCEEESEEVKLILSSGIYEISVKTENVNDALEINFDKTIPIPGTFGEYKNGKLDILTKEEKKFKDSVDNMLKDREDEFAELFRKDNTREIGGRGLVLLEKIKAEIKNDDVLTDNEITSFQLISTFIELTKKYVDSCNAVEKLQKKHDALLEEYRATFEEDSKKTKKIARDIEVANRKIDSNDRAMNYYSATIRAAVMPVLNMELCR